MFSSHSAEKSLLLLAKDGDLEGISALFQPKKGLLFGQKEAKIDLNYINKDSSYEDYGLTAIMVAAKYGKLEVIKHLVDERGAELSAQKDEENMTALMVAARYGQLEVVQYLVEEGKRSVKFADEDGWTPFMYAAYNSNIDVMKYLCTKPKNDVEAVTKKGETAFLLAVSALKEKKKQWSECKDLPTIVYLVEEVKVNIFAKDNSEKPRSALAYAAAKGRKKIVSYLLEKGLGDDLEDRLMACTMAMTASNVYSPDLISFNTNERKKSHVNTFKLLVTEDVLNYNGQIILFRAALHGALEVLQYLLEEHSTTFDVNQIFKIQSECTLLYVATKKDYEDIADYLLSKGVKAARSFSSVSEIQELGTPLSNKIMRKYLCELEEEKVPIPSEGSQFVSHNKRLIVRSDPDLSSTEIAKLPKGTVVTIAGKRVAAYCEDTATVKIRFKVIAPAAYEGWISSKNLVLFTGDESIPTSPTGSNNINKDGNTSPMATPSTSIKTETKINDDLLLSSALSNELRAAYCQYYLNTVDKNLLSARNQRNTEAIKAAIAKKKSAEMKVVTIREEKSLSHKLVPEEFVSLESTDLRSQLDWILSKVSVLMENLYSTAESDEEFDRVEELESFYVLIQKDAEASGVSDNSMKGSQKTTCCITDSIIDGKDSSGSCTVVNAIYSTPFITNREVKVKLRPMTTLADAEYEFRMLMILHEANPKRFVKPYELIRSSPTSSIQLTSSHGERLDDNCGIVMEKGHESLSDYLGRKSDASRLELLAIAEVLVDILVAAHKANVVLMDFKPANVVRCFDENHEIVWKAIDFDCSRMLGEPITRNITAQYGCYEVAKFVLSPSTTTPPSATKAMDICALGWIVWKMMMGRSLWDELGIANDDSAVLKVLTTITDKDLAKHIAHFFPKPNQAPLRRWLEHALAVDPLSRPAAATLKSNYSLLGHRESTINMNTLAERIVSDVDVKLTIHTENMTKRIIDRIDDLSTEFKEHFGNLESSLLKASVSFAMEGNSSAVDGLVALLEAQREEAQQGKLDMKNLLQQMERMNNELQTNVVQPITSALLVKEDSVSQTEKLDTILEMMKDMKVQLNDIQSLQKQQLSLLGEMNRNGNFIPHLFCIIPEVKREKLDKPASKTAKALNWMMRMTDSISRIAWSRSRLVFICPVTLQMVPCGNDGKGYLIEMPSQLLKTAVPILKIGLTLVKVALATQGLGNVVPNVADFLPPSFDLDAISGIMEDISSKISEAEESLIAKVENSPEIGTMQQIFQLVAKAEGCDLSDTVNSWMKWRPQQTGLVLTVSEATGSSAWVSPTVQEEFQKYGEKCFKNTTDK